MVIASCHWQTHFPGSCKMEGAYVTLVDCKGKKPILKAYIQRINSCHSHHMHCTYNHEFEIESYHVYRFLVNHYIDLKLLNMDAHV